MDEDYRRPLSPYLVVDSATFDRRESFQTQPPSRRSPGREPWNCNRLTVVRYDAAMAWRTFGQSFITLLVILDPLGNVPLFLALTRHDDPRARHRAAYVAILVAGIILA
ncbi:MAG: MarC family protein, partial [Actinomycetota bacterium]